MKNLVVTLPDQAFFRAETEAKALGLEIATLCTGVLSDHFLNSPIANTIISSTPPTPTTAGTPNTVRPSPNGAFNVAKEFPGFPARSVEFAQRFVNAALKFPNVAARAGKRMESA